MIITNQNKVLVSNNNRIIVNDSVNYFLGITSTDWAEPTNWSLGFLPTATQMIFVLANATITSNTALSIKSLTVPAGVTLNINVNATLIINGSLDNYGIINYSSNITLTGTVTRWTNSGQFNFTGSTSQVVAVQPSITFPANLILPTLGGVQSVWYLSGDISIMGNFSPNQSVLELSSYNMTVYGTCNANSGGIKNTIGAGGNVINLYGKVTSNQGVFFGQISGNPTVYMRGGYENGAVVAQVPNAPTQRDFTVIFTGNDQTVTIGNNNVFACTNLIADGVTVTINDNNTTPINQSALTAANYYSCLIVRNVIDGTGSLSKIIVNNQGITPFFVNPATAPMNGGGLFQINNADGNVNLGLYSESGNNNVHPYWGGSFDYLYASTQSNNDGTQSFNFTRSLTVRKALDIRGVSKVDVGANNLTCLGTAYINYSILNSPARYSCLNGSGNSSWLFAGQCTIGKGTLLTGQNINIEFRNGVVVEDTATTVAGISPGLDFGNGTVKFTTNNQTFDIKNYKVALGSVLVDNNITLTMVSSTPDTTTTTTKFFTVNSLNGAGVNSKVISKAAIFYTSATDLPMTVGQLDLSSNLNTFVYNAPANTDQNIKAGTYWNLVFRMVSGSGNKIATGDIVLLGDYFHTSSNMIVLGNFNLTINGGSTLQGTLNKSGPGTLLFIGSISINGGIVNLGVSANIECRGNLTYSSTAAATWGAGIKFTTNNQTVSWGSSAVPQAVVILISGAITITYSSSGSMILTGSLNGDNANSSFINTGAIDFRNTGTLMATGKFYADSAVNTVIYNTTLAQDIRIPTDGNYRNLTLTGNPSTKNVGGSGGTVNVRGIYAKNTNVTVVGTITNNP